MNKNFVNFIINLFQLMKLVTEYSVYWLIEKLSKLGFLFCEWLVNLLVDEKGNIRGKSNRESRNTQIQDIIEDESTRKVYRDGVGFIDERVG